MVKWLQNFQLMLGITNFVEIEVLQNLKNFNENLNEIFEGFLNTFILNVFPKIKTSNFAQSSREYCRYSVL